jgi:hypothetical protein
MDVVAQLANGPNAAANIEVIERLMALRDREEDKRKEQEFNAAMSTAQAEMRPVAADANNPQTRSRYASYLALDRQMRPIYTRHGFGLSFNTAEPPSPDFVRVICDVSHKSGHSRRYQVDMPSDGKGAKGGDVMTKTHATGAAMTYGQRYLLKMIFNIAVGEDDDGRYASKPRVTQAQADTIRDLLESTGKSRDKFLKWAKVEKIEDLAAEHYDACVAAIQGKPAK